MSLALPALMNGQRNAFAAALFCVALAGGIFCFPASYLLHTNVIIGLVLFPFALMVTGGCRNNLAYLLFVAFFSAFALMYNVRVAYFFALGFFILWSVEYLFGRCNPLVVFLLAIMSPVFTQVTTILGFPLRLQLSEVSASVLRMASFDARAEGNMIVLDGSVFSVDEACMGLSMLAMSMLMAVFVLSYRMRMSGKEVGLIKVAMFFMIVFVLNMITNLFRILLLVLFRIPPENSMHDVIGLLCFVCYTILPVYLISVSIIKDGRQIATDYSPRGVLSRWQKGLLMSLAVGMLLTGVRVGTERMNVDTRHADVFYADGKVERIDGGVTKITNEELLMYVKPIPEFFTSEHTPLMCWKGSGYVFSGVKEIAVDGSKVYTGKLVKGNDELFTAWWYSNGKVQTISQLEWRTRMLKREDRFCLVNLTAKDEATLMRIVVAVLSENRLLRVSDNP